MPAPRWVPSTDGGLECRIEHMALGESGYAAPWAMHVDSMRRGWLQPGHTVHNPPGITNAMLITRTTQGYAIETTLHPASSLARYQWTERTNTTGMIAVISPRQIPKKCMGSSVLPLSSNDLEYTNKSDTIDASGFGMRHRIALPPRVNWRYEPTSEVYTVMGQATIDGMIAALEAKPVAEVAKYEPPAPKPEPAPEPELNLIDFLTEEDLEFFKTHGGWQPPAKSALKPSEHYENKASTAVDPKMRKGYTALAKAARLSEDPAIRELERSATQLSRDAARINSDIDKLSAKVQAVKKAADQESQFWKIVHHGFWVVCTGIGLLGLGAIYEGVTADQQPQQAQIRQEEAHTMCSYIAVALANPPPGDTTRQLNALRGQFEALHCDQENK